MILGGCHSVAGRDGGGFFENRIKLSRTREVRESLRLLTAVR